MFATSRPARDVAHLWTPELKRELFELRVQYSRGSRQLQWPAIAAALSERCGTRFSIEDTRKKSRALVKRLTAHGMPSGYSITQQLEYLQQFPAAFETREDRNREQLRAWGAENGISIRPGTAPAPPAPPANSAPAEGGSTGCSSEATSQARANRMSELLQQTQYLRFLDNGAEAAQTEGAGEELPVADDPEASVVEDTRGQPRKGRALEVLKGVTSAKHPAAAALRAFLFAKGPDAARHQDAQSRRLASVAGDAAAAALDVPARGVGERGRLFHENIPTAAAVELDNEMPDDTAAVPPPAAVLPPVVGTAAARQLTCSHQGGSPGPQSRQQPAIPHTGSAAGGLTEYNAGGTAAASTSRQREQRQGAGAVGALSSLHGNGVSGLLGDGRWIQDVKVNPAQRRARIAALQSANRLMVCVQMPQWREEQRLTQGRVGLSGCAVLARCARKKETNNNSHSVPRSPGAGKKKAVCELGEVAGDPKTVSEKKQKRASRSKARKPSTSKTETASARGNNCTGVGGDDAHIAEGAVEAGEVDATEATEEVATRGGGAEELAEQSASRAKARTRARSSRRNSAAGGSSQAGDGEVTAGKVSGTVVIDQRCGYGSRGVNATVASPAGERQAVVEAAGAAEAMMGQRGKKRKQQYSEGSGEEEVCKDGSGTRRSV